MNSKEIHTWGRKIIKRILSVSKWKGVCGGVGGGGVYGLYWINNLAIKISYSKKIMQFESYFKSCLVTHVQSLLCVFYMKQSSIVYCSLVHSAIFNLSTSPLTCGLCN